MTDKRFTLRIDENLFNKLKELAERDKRSIAKEIEHLLEKYIEQLEKENP